MFYRHLPYIFIIVLLQSFNGDDSFHPAESAQERALEAILKQIELNDQDNITDSLLVSIRQANDNAIDSNGTTCVPREVCGLNFNPFLCAPHPNDSYLFDTLAVSENHAIINYRWPKAIFEEESSIPNATYKIIRQEGRWVMDGITCGEYKFNME